MSSVQLFDEFLGKAKAISLRSTLVTLKSGHRVLISPIKFSGEQLHELKNNPPNALIAPNCFQHLYIKKASEYLRAAKELFNFCSSAHVIL